MDYKLNFLLVGAFWGITNPFLKRSLKGMDEVKKNSHINQLFADLYFLIFNWKYLIPFLIANCGSVIYYFTLQKTGPPDESSTKLINLLLMMDKSPKQIKSKFYCFGIIQLISRVRHCIEKLT
ncbi:transmembrane protein 234 homolog isoform X2 [Rhodnius prolixus]|uniref:transmembrane protein 234 homolog isoform X2 n=1 Tax=Rhodnius prolixus TaxID=13249 RepID=UPI003D18A7B2